MKLEVQEEGLNIRKWAQWKRALLTTGLYNPDEYEQLNYYQKAWTADVLNTLKALENIYENNCESDK
jgi:hypothetical protein